MQFNVVCLWETMLCMSDIYAVVLQYWIVPLLVSNIVDIILVGTQYVLVCTSLYYYTIPVLVCTEYALVRTGSEQVHTKYPIPVMRFTIPDVCKEYAV